MHVAKLRNRLEKLPDGMPVVVEHNGKLYKVLTAKKFRNQIRHGSDEYFNIVTAEETKKEDLRDTDK